MPGEGQFVYPVQVEVTSNIGADVGIDGVAPSGADLRGLAVMGYYAAGNKLFVIRTDASGNLLTSGGGGGGTTPGTVITTPADTAVGASATVALPVPPAGTLSMTVQNVGPAGTFIRVREAGGTAGAGIVLGRFSSVTYGLPGGSIAALEVEEIVTVATSVAIQFQRT